MKKSKNHATRPASYSMTSTHIHAKYTDKADSLKHKYFSELSTTGKIFSV
jgi:hypothetical protein